MSRQAAKMVSAILVNILAGAPLLTTAVHAETAPADNCLAAPKNETPAGSHWFYRVDHANKRNCWYLRREGEVTQALPQTRAPAPAAKASLADAHAELRPQASVREDAMVANPPGAATSASNTAGSDANSPNVWNATAAVATRWPESSSASSAPKFAQAAAEPANNAPQPVAAASTMASSTASVADLPMSVQPEMIPILIAATVGALAVAGGVALISIRLRRSVRRRRAGSAGGPIWDTTDDDRIVLSDYPAMDDRDFRPRFARGAASAAFRHQRAAEFVPRRARG